MQYIRERNFFRILILYSVFNVLPVVKNFRCELIIKLISSFPYHFHSIVSRLHNQEYNNSADQLKLKSVSPVPAEEPCILFHEAQAGNTAAKS